MRLLFVCVHNAGRSQMAEAFVNHMARARGLNVSAESAGTISGKSLNPMAVSAMQELGIDISEQVPKLLSQSQIDQVDRVISMGCGVDAEACPVRFVLAEDWNLDDPAGQDFETVRSIRDQIRDRVESMLNAL